MDLASQLSGQIEALRRARVRHQSELDQLAFNLKHLRQAEDAVAAAEAAINDLLERMIGVPHASPATF